jgi:hypothetical protein
LADITLHPKFGDLVGYTQTELELYSEEWIEDVLQGYPGVGRAELLEEVRRWYNGYNWRGPNNVYNPFSILNFFSTGSFEDYWFKTGYLTIREYDQHLGMYTLDYPNREVEQALSNHLIGSLLHRSSLDASAPCCRMDRRWGKF